MKNVIMFISLILVFSFLIGCKAGDKLDIKTAENEISNDIRRSLEESMMDIGFNGLKLKKATKENNAAFIGIAIFSTESGKIEEEILANYESDILTWWYSDDPDDISYIPLGDSVYQMASESPGYEYEETSQSVSNSDNRQSNNTQSTINLGKVEQRGSTFTTYNSSGNQITYFNNPNKELVGWGKDFFVIRSGTSFYTYDAHCKQISTISIGGATTATVDTESFTVKVGSSNQKYNRSCRKM